MESLKVFLFGVPRFEYANTTITMPRRKSVALIAYLALSPHAQSRDTLATLLWPDLDEQHAHAALRSTLHSLRAAVPQINFIPNHKTLTFDPQLVWIDVRAFRDVLIAARLHTHSIDAMCDECAVLFRQAVEIPRGEFLEGFNTADSADFEHWQLFQREMLRKEYGTLFRRLAEYYGSEKHQAYDAAIDYAQRWLSLDPLHEPAHRLLMKLYVSNDQPYEALKQYEQCAAILAKDLITQPDTVTTSLYEDIRKQFNSPLTGESRPSNTASVIPRYPVLMIGREKALSDLKNRLIYARENQRRTVLIQGWPGVGKSTLTAAIAHDADMHQAFPDGVLWTSLGESPNLNAELLRWARAFALIDHRSSYEQAELTTLLTSALRAKRVLLLIDDVWDAAHAEPFRVGGQHCVHLFTSRLNSVVETLAPSEADIYRLPVLTQEDGYQLLAALAPQAATEFPQDSRTLVTTLEGLPLAIHVASKLLVNEIKYGWGLRDLLDNLREGTTLLSAQLPADMRVSWQTAPPTVAALLRRSTDVLDKLTQSRYADLGLFGAKPATFDLSAMAAVWQSSDPKPTARMLVDRGLLEPVVHGRFQMHALLVLHARSLRVLRDKAFL